MTITRIPGSAPGRSRGTVHNDLVWAVATASDMTPSITEQTRQTLEALEQVLADAGSDKSRILSGTVYLSDMSMKSEMDKVWIEWVGDNPDNWPQRACVGTALGPDTLVEIVLVAAVR